MSTEPDDPRAQRNGGLPEKRDGAVLEERDGAVLEVHRDGTLTLYGLEEYTDVSDAPLIRDTSAPEKTTGTDEPDPDERTGPTA